ncbi:hypothetical protein Goklo_028363 [Gossypium klotzschianum]|uniref:Uncharacterized protein n=1 Tax=Gossypium klotzschianum TaxID=34286 RepID=A0A7J8U128_9ROSI|nr:hypothetical protein [Gossypium klotzschianum]
MCQIIGANGIKIIKYLYFLMRSGAVIVLPQFMVLMLQTLCKPFLAILKLLFDEYVKNSKSMSSSLAGSSNVSDNDPVDSSLHELNVNRANLRGDYDESDDYK